MTDIFNKELLSPSAQDEYWRNINPDIRTFLDKYEEKEEWTYSYNEMPEIFNQISHMLPKFKDISINEQNTDSIQPIIRKLIVLLASLPLRQAISAISWLDRNIKNETDIGWGVAIYIESAKITKYYIDDPDYRDCKLLYDRVNLMLNSNLSCLLFLKIQKIGNFYEK